MIANFHDNDYSINIVVHFCNNCVCFKLSAGAFVSAKTFTAHEHTKEQIQHSNRLQRGNLFVYCFTWCGFSMWRCGLWLFV